jgi:hypothetical protein
MKTLKLITSGIALVSIFSSCGVFKSDSVTQYEIDPVCGMKVDKSEAFSYKYNGKTYFFDKNNC